MSKEDGGKAHLKKIWEWKAINRKFSLPDAKLEELVCDYLKRRRDELLTPSNHELLWNVSKVLDVSHRVLRDYLQQIEEVAEMNQGVDLDALLEALAQSAERLSGPANCSVWAYLADLVFDNQTPLGKFTEVAERLSVPRGAVYLAGFEFLKKSGFEELPSLAEDEEIPYRIFCQSELGQTIAARLETMDHTAVESSVQPVRPGAQKPTSPAEPARMVTPTPPPGPASPPPAQPETDDEKVTEIAEGKPVEGGRGSWDLLAAESVQDLNSLFQPEPEEKRWEYVGRLFAKGVPRKVIAHLLGRSYVQVASWLNSSGRRKRVRHPSAEDEARYAYLSELVQWRKPEPRRQTPPTPPPPPPPRPTPSLISPIPPPQPQPTPPPPAEKSTKKPPLSEEAKALRGLDPEMVVAALQEYGINPLGFARRVHELYIAAIDEKLGQREE